MGAKLCTDHEFQTTVRCCLMSSHDAGHRAFISDCQSGVTQVKRLIDQLSRMRSPSQETEVADAVKFGISPSARYVLGGRLTVDSQRRWAHFIPDSRFPIPRIKTRTHADTTRHCLLDLDTPIDLHRCLCARCSNPAAHRPHPTNRFQYVRDRI